ncbi:hypothetical protein OF83DRAFT_396754 [Amylostereum chailletii]|nr:hypothetical protein OF83DRAFT_396754 [Amylostereum chailletii]
MLPLRSYVFIGLNAVRALSIIGCLLVFSSSIVTLVHDIQAVNHFVEAGKTGNGLSNSTDTSMFDQEYVPGSTVPNQPAGAAFAVINRVLIIFQVIVLIFSELGWPQAFFDRFFPVLGSDFGLGALGIMQVLLGSAILSHHVDDFSLVSAFFLASIGCLNMLLGLIFRHHAKPKRSISSWREQAKGVLPPGVTTAASAASSLSSRVFNGKHAEEKPDEGQRWAGYGFGRQGEKKAGLKGFLISKPLESLPRYAPSRPAGARASSPPV